jgi:hypothetical protein
MGICRRSARPFSSSKPPARRRQLVYSKDTTMAKWWLISWTTYGTWLPGDIRGYCTRRGEKYIEPPRRYAKPGEAIYNPAEHTAVRESAELLSDSAVYFRPSEKRIAFGALVGEIDQIPVCPAIISVGRSHVHWLCYFGTLEIRPIVGRVKSAATRELNASGFQGKRPWTKGCNIKSKATRRECRAAYKYVAEHEKQDCLIHRWAMEAVDLDIEVH